MREVACRARLFLFCSHFSVVLSFDSFLSRFARVFSPFFTRFSSIQRMHFVLSASYSCSFNCIFTVQSKHDLFFFFFWNASKNTYKQLCSWDIELRFMRLPMMMMMMKMICGVAVGFTHKLVQCWIRWMRIRNLRIEFIFFCVFSFKFYFCLYFESIVGIRRWHRRHTYDVRHRCADMQLFMQSE